MRFLKDINDRSEEPDSKAIQIRQVVQMTVQCDSCSYWGKMSGGQMVGKDDTGVFECPECENLKFIKWMFG